MVEHVGHLHAVGRAETEISIALEKPGSSSMGSNRPPLCPIARWNNPLASGEAINALIDIAPED